MPNKTEAIRVLEDKTLVQHSCRSCSHAYWVYRDQRAKDEPIERCCLCRYREKDPGHIDTYQTKSIVRLRA